MPTAEAHDTGQRKEAEEYMNCIGKTRTQTNNVMQRTSVAASLAAQPQNKPQSPMQGCLSSTSPPT